MLEGALPSSGLTGNTGAGKRSRAHATFICCLDKSSHACWERREQMRQEAVAGRRLLQKGHRSLGFRSVLTEDSTQSRGVRILCERGSCAPPSSEPQQSGLVQPHKRPLEMKRLQSP